MFKVVHGFAGEIQLSMPRGIKFRGLISELLGHTASLEGSPYIFRSLGAAMSDVLDLRVVIPPFCGTAVVPISFDSPASRLILACVCPKLFLIKDLPFKSLQLPCPYGPSLRGLEAGHQILEFYETRKLIEEGAKGEPPHPQVQYCQWMVHQEWRLWGFGLYLFFGDNEEGPFLVTDVSQQNLRRAGSNWVNLFIPIGTPMQCHPGDTIELCCTSHTLNALEPEYKFEISVRGFRREVHSVTLEFGYSDIILRMYKYKELMKEVGGKTESPG